MELDHTASQEVSARPPWPAGCECGRYRELVEAAGVPLENDAPYFQVQICYLLAGLKQTSMTTYRLIPPL